MLILGGGSTTSDEEHGPKVPLLEILEQRAVLLQEAAPLPALLAPEGGALAAPER